MSYAPCQLLVLAGPEHGRTIPLAEMASRSEAMEFQLPPAFSRLLLDLERLFNRSKDCRGLTNSVRLRGAARVGVLNRRQRCTGPGTLTSFAPVSVRIHDQIYSRSVFRNGQFE